MSADVVPSDSFYKEHTLEHYRQRSTWDCGLSCVLMVLGAEGRAHLAAHLPATAAELGFGQSTWTIDLCYVLRKYSLRHLYYTTSAGVNHAYHNQSYYEKNIDKDRERVLQRFQEASAHGIEFVEASVAFEELIEHLRRNGPIIVLVDANRLVCDLCKFNKLQRELSGCLPWAQPYMGHYIVLSGYNLRKGKFLYRNPSFKDRLCALSFRDLEVARQSFGTDEDVILIFPHVS